MSVAENVGYGLARSGVQSRSADSALRTLWHWSIWRDSATVTRLTSLAASASGSHWPGRWSTTRDTAA